MISDRCCSTHCFLLGLSDRSCWSLASGFQDPGLDPGVVSLPGTSLCADNFMSSLTDLEPSPDRRSSVAETHLTRRRFGEHQSCRRAFGRGHDRNETERRGGEQIKRQQKAEVSLVYHQRVSEEPRWPNCCPDVVSHFCSAAGGIRDVRGQQLSEGERGGGWGVSRSGEEICWIIGLQFVVLTSKGDPCTPRALAL